VVSAYSLTFGQSRPTTLTIHMENVVDYFETFKDPQSNGTAATEQSPPTGPAAFYPGTLIADVKTINGVKAAGTAIARNFVIGINPNPTGSTGIGDIVRGGLQDIYLEILQADGTTQVGTLVLTGAGPGHAPPGAPSAATAGNFAVIGGTGAYLGATGQAATIQNSRRNTTTLENPINRRNFDSGTWDLAVLLTPAAAPSIIMTDGGPAIAHASDGSLVTPANPAHAGETLTLYASGLGPTNPGVDAGQPFTANPRQVANSPIAVLVNGTPADVLYAGGYPNTSNAYQVNFRVPGDAVAGKGTIQVNAAWIEGTAVTIPIQ
jgi:hypothetical protein